MRNSLKILILLSASINFAKAQSKGKSFSKVEAISWLNAKMEGASAASTVGGKGEYTVQKPKFSGCSFFTRVEFYKMDAYNAMHDIKDDVLYYNEFTANLSALDPSSLTIQRDGDKFYVKVSSTNSLRTVTRKIYYPGKGYPSETIEFVNISFGPFDVGNNLETRVSNVVKKLIASCGGKKEAF